MSIKKQKPIIDFCFMLLKTRIEKHIAVLCTTFGYIHESEE